MPDPTDHLLDKIKQEFLLPEINADACLHATFSQADCQACVDICPAQAWILDDDALGLDTEMCDGCGLCVPACPSGALHVHFPWVIRSIGGRMIALFACDQSGIKEDSGVFPCIHALGLRQLLLLYKSGIQHLLITTAECSECNRNQSVGIQLRLKQINRLLQERNKQPMKILQRSPQIWRQAFKSDEVISRGTRLSRREFLRGSGKQLRHQLVVLDPLNRPEGLAGPPGQLLPNHGDTEAHWLYVPKIDENLCNGCDACMKLCPTNALQLIHDKAVKPSYCLVPENCIGCNVCVLVCNLQAMSINLWSISTPYTINLVKKRCKACGNSFHLPSQNSLSLGEFCPICQKHNHSSNLFQMLDENSHSGVLDQEPSSFA